MKHVVVTGMYRSGTTLLHHLLDSHTQLNVFPVENCILRDTLFFRDLPHPSQRSIAPLIEYVLKGDFERALDYIEEHEKLGLPLKKRIDLAGSTGDQEIDQEFDSEVFRKVFLEQIALVQSLPRNDVYVVLYEAYQLAYFSATGRPTLSSEAILTNKCPEAGLMIQYCLDNLEQVRVIHVVRDPRSVIASFKAALSKSMYHSFFRLTFQLKLLRHSYGCKRKYASDDRVMVVRYEDLVVEPEKVMSSIADHIGIDVEPTLVEPTLNGHPWKANSSNINLANSSYAITADLTKYRNKLNPVEIKFIESQLRTEMQDFGYIIESDEQSLGDFGVKSTYIFRSLFHAPTYYFKALRRLKNAIN